MLFLVRFTDHPDRLEIRKQNLTAHLAWLDERSTAILVAGSVRPAPDAAPAGAVWVVEAATRDEVEALFQSDPFWTSGLRQGFEILLWSKAFPDRKALV